MSGKMRFLGILALLALLCGLAFAQTETGSIVGTITDPQGAVVAGAKVTLKNVNTNAERSTVSNSNGLYTIPNLQPGSYEVKVEAPNFAPVAKKVNVTVGSRNTIDFPLAITGGATTVEVVGEGGVQVETTSQSLSQVVTGTQITTLPTFDRDPYGLIQTSGNISSDANGATGRGVGYSINGGRAASTDILLDGGENVDLFTAVIGQSTPLDSVGEFRVITSDFSAEYGRASAGVVNVSTKAGTNDFHGSVFEYYRGSALSANTPENNASGIQKGRFDRNQFGYSVGGPIIKNKLFFFNSVEWTRVRSAQTIKFWVIDPAFLALSGAGMNAYYAADGDLTGTNLTGDVLTKADVLASGVAGTAPVNGAAECFFGGCPWNAVAAGTPVFDLGERSVPTDAGGGVPQNQYNIVGRFDWNFTDKTTVYGRYALQSGDFLPGSNTYSPYSQFITGSEIFNNNALVSLTHIWGPNVVTQTKVVFNRLNNFQPLNGPPTPTLFFNRRTIPAFGAFPSGELDGPGYLPQAPGAAIPFGGPQNLGQIYQDVSWTVGKHQFRFGGQYIYMKDNRSFGAYENAVATLSTSSLQRSLNQFLQSTMNTSYQVAIDPQGKQPCPYDPTTGTTPGILLADPACSVTLPAVQPRFDRANRYHDFAFYAQDSWKIHPRFTLNLGVRWEYYGVQHNNDPSIDSNLVYGAGSNFWERYRNGETMNTTDPRNYVGGLWYPDYNNWAPRIGFAWDIFGDGRTSLRGGYGIAYERNFGNVTFNVEFNPPNYFVVSLTPGDFGGTPVPFDGANLGPFSSPLPPPNLKGLPRASIRQVDQNIQTAYMHTWSLSLERELMKNTVLAFEYSGSHGLKGYDLTTLNRRGTGILALGDSPFIGNNYTACASNQYSCAGSFRRGNGGFSNYNALNVKFQSSALWHTGLQLTANYTWSHAIDNLSSTFSDSGSNFNTGLLDVQNPALDKGSADFDIRHRVVISGIWDVPWFKNDSNWIKKNVLGGWEFAPIVTLQTGNPFTLFDCNNGFLYCMRVLQSGSAISGNCTSDTLTGANTYECLTYTTDEAGAYGNPLLAPVIGSSGSSDVGACTTPGEMALHPCPWPSNMLGRNYLRGPGQINTDFALYKNINITERYKLQFQTQFLNLFNHPDQFIDAGTLDVSSCGASGTIGFPPTPGVPVSCTVNQNKIGHRNITLALKFIF